MIEKQECVVEDNHNSLWLKAFLKKKNAKPWEENDKENARFLLSHNKNVITLCLLWQIKKQLYFIFIQV